MIKLSNKFSTDSSARLSHTQTSKPIKQIWLSLKYSLKTTDKLSVIALWLMNGICGYRNCTLGIAKLLYDNKFELDHCSGSARSGSKWHCVVVRCKLQRFQNQMHQSVTSTVCSSILFSGFPEAIWTTNFAVNGLLGHQFWCKWTFFLRRFISQFCRHFVNKVSPEVGHFAHINLVSI